MKKIMFYCQNLMGMGHLVRSAEIIRSLVTQFEVCLIDGGPVVQNFEIPCSVKTIRIPALRVRNRNLEVVDNNLNLEEVKEIRKHRLLQIFDEFQPDCLITEGYPFSKGKLAFELIPLLEKVKSSRGRTKAVCCVRDIVLSKNYYQDKAKLEIKKRDLINRYYDLLLVHSDPKIHKLEENFSLTGEINCNINYTGYVAQSPPKNLPPTAEDIAGLSRKEPMILVSIGGGRFGHELIEKILDASIILEKFLPHKIQIFTGPFMPEEKFLELQKLATNKNNINFRRYTAHLLSYMRKAALSISLGGYNTTMNVLRTGVNAMIYPSNDGSEQRTRSEKLERLGILDVLRPEDLPSERLAQKIITSLHKKRDIEISNYVELQGAQNTTRFIQELLKVDSVNPGKESSFKWQTEHSLSI
ncbi:glycosyltransferase [Mastigocoleus sp. MO_188.B34]|uniref:glycosyltransferase family protein n=1 Tax=Mastigocoleus sp. MO_188.B34 TaxID=3036635 RepID=UPI002629A135|nr:glycosyltransferase [Mastigocoleus sp. MO_188.B34]